MTPSFFLVYLSSSICFIHVKRLQNIYHSESYFPNQFCHLHFSHLLGFQFVSLKCHVPNWIQSVLLLKLEYCWAEQKDYCTGLTHTVTVSIIKCSICLFFFFSQYKHLIFDSQAIYILMCNNISTFVGMFLGLHFL